jgi:ParB family chromosome partitioning protein
VAKENFSLKGKLPSVDELFKSDEDRADDLRERVHDIEIANIKDFDEHPFRVLNDREMLELVQSVCSNGVLVPCIVKPLEDGKYVMISGHRRKLAAKRAGLDTLPCIIRNFSNEEATIVMVDSNMQRETILPSEKAFAYKMKLEAIKSLAGRPKKNSSPMETNLFGATSAEIVAAQANESRAQIYRYICLSDLIPGLLELVDNSVLKEKDKPQIALRPAVELSYLNEQQQEFVLEAIHMEYCTPSHAQALLLREKAKTNELTMTSVLEIMQQAKPNQIEQYKLPKDKIAQFFPEGASPKEIESDIIQGLELLKEKREQNNQDS